MCSLRNDPSAYNLFSQSGVLMKVMWSVVIAALLAGSVGVKALPSQGDIAISIDEGIVGRVQILDQVSGYVGFGYHLMGPDTVTNQPLSQLSWKLGGEYLLKQWDRLRFNAFGEWRQALKQGQLEPAVDGTILRYNQWSSYFRVGVRPELFLLDNLSIDYKMAVQFVSHGPTFKLNAERSSTESNHNDYREFGFYSGSNPFWDGNPLLFNIGITLYFAKLF